MTTVTWLIICAVGLPLAGALVIRLAGERRPAMQRWLAVIIFGLVGLAAVAIFLINEHFACILASGRQNCLFDGLGTLTLFLLSLGLAAISLADDSSRRTNRRDVYVLRLLLVGAWAGMGVIPNLLGLLLSINLFLYIIYRWQKMRGLTWRILALRDDYKDDSNG